MSFLRIAFTAILVAALFPLAHAKACTVVGHGKVISVEGHSAYNPAGKLLYYMKPLAELKYAVIDARTKSEIGIIDVNSRSLTEAGENGIMLVLYQNEIVSSVTQMTVARDANGWGPTVNPSFSCNIPAALMAGYAIAASL